MQRPDIQSNKAKIIEFLDAYQIDHDPTITKAKLLALIPDGVGDDNVDESKEDADKNAEANASKNALALVEEKKQKQAEIDYENSINAEVKTAKANLDEAERIMKQCRETISEANIRLDEAKKACTKAKDVLGMAQKSAKLSSKELEEKSLDYFERFENIEEIHGTEDGTFFFTVQSAREAKGRGAKVVTFKR